MEVDAETLNTAVREHAVYLGFDPQDEGAREIACRARHRACPRKTSARLAPMLTTHTTMPRNRVKALDFPPNCRCRVQT